jgi:hypothetical protein
MKTPGAFCPGRGVARALTPTSPARLPGVAVASHDRSPSLSVIKQLLMRKVSLTWEFRDWLPQGCGNLYLFTCGVGSCGLMATFCYAAATGRNTAVHDVGCGG